MKRRNSMKGRFQLLLLILAASIAVSAFGDTILLKTGARYDGATVTRQSKTYVTFRDQNGRSHRLAMRNVASMERSPATNANSTFGKPAAGFQRPPSAARVSITIPTSTDVTVRTIDNIDSKTATAGQKFAGSIENDIHDSTGAVAIPRGSDAELIIETNTGGGMSSASDLVLDVDAITVAGTRYLVATTDIEHKGKQGLGANKRTAEMAGGGAAIGALIGALAGHGKGAAIGALIGGAAGAGGEVLTKGKEVRIPSETVLSFKLEQDLVLRQAR
jgi:hypothetical protein